MSLTMLKPAFFDGLDEFDPHADAQNARKQTTITAKRNVSIIFGPARRAPWLLPMPRSALECSGRRRYWQRVCGLEVECVEIDLRKLTVKSDVLVREGQR